MDKASKKWKSKKVKDRTVDGGEVYGSE